MTVNATVGIWHGGKEGRIVEMELDEAGYEAISRLAKLVSGEEPWEMVVREL